MKFLNAVVVHPNTLSRLATCQSTANSSAQSTNITEPLTPALGGNFMPFSQRYKISGHPEYTVQPTWVLSHLKRRRITPKIMTDAVFLFIDECRVEYTNGPDQEVHQVMTKRDPRPPLNQRILMRIEKPKPRTGLTRDILEQSFLTILSLMQNHRIPFQETFWYIRGPEVQDGSNAAMGPAPKIVEVGRASIQVYIR